MGSWRFLFPIWINYLRKPRVRATKFSKHHIYVLKGLCKTTDLYKSVWNVNAFSMATNHFLFQLQSEITFHCLKRKYKRVHFQSKQTETASCFVVTCSFVWSFRNYAHDRSFESSQMCRRDSLFRWKQERIQSLFSAGTFITLSVWLEPQKWYVQWQHLGNLGSDKYFHGKRFGNTKRSIDIISQCRKYIHIHITYTQISGITICW